MVTSSVGSRVPAKRGTSGAVRRPVGSKPAVVVDTNVLLEWFELFDRRMADLSARQRVLLRDLGVEPVTHPVSPEQSREFA